MKLLMINDEILTVETMKTDIPWSEYGIDEVFTAYDVETAKACIQEHPIDLLLCDIEMPGENGISLLRWIRESKKDMECIFLTCHASFEYAKEAIQLGCQDYLLIPAKYEDIGAAVLKVVNRIKAQREATRYQEYGKQAVKEKIDRTTESFGQKKTEDPVSAAISYILKNIGSETLSVNEIADKLFIHPVYLNRIFKKEKGISVGQFIIGERMRLAADLLKSRNLSANAVAESVGYKSYSNFNLMFKKVYGYAPSQFQEQFKSH
jgi:Response regulator containing CheY-like receiver domain and AraC-type DNA-binding domain